MRLSSTIVGCLLIVGNVLSVFGQTGDYVLIGRESPAAGSLFAHVSARDAFGSAVDVGDINGDGVPELLVGAPGTNSLGVDRGRVYVLFLSLDGTVQTYSMIDDTAPVLAGAIHDGDELGSSIHTLGDIDGNGDLEVAVGARRSDDGGRDRGAVWLLSLDRNGNAVASQKISNPCSGFAESSGCDGSEFGSSIASVAAAGDFTAGPRLLVGSPGNRASGINGGAISILQLDPQAPFMTEHTEEFVVPAEYGRPAVAPPGAGGLRLPRGALFGSSLALVRGSLEIPFFVVAGAPFAEPGGMRAAGSIVAISLDSTSLGIQRVLLDGTTLDGRFGRALAAHGDVDGNGYQDVAVGAPGVREQRGEVFMVFLSQDGSAIASIPLIERVGLPVKERTNFGTSVARLPGIGSGDPGWLAVGAPLTDIAGAVWLVRPPLVRVPEIRDVSHAPEVPSEGEPVTVTVAAYDESGIDIVRLFMRRGGDLTFFAEDMASVDESRFRALIPADLVDSRGLEYFVEVTNVLGLNARLPRDGVVTLSVRVVGGKPIRIRHGSEAGGYRLISVPLRLDQPNAQSILEPQLGAHQRSRWRFFDFHDGRLVELGGRGIELQPGRSYWVIVKDRDRVVNTGPGTTIRTDRPFSIPLRPQWNLVANPFDFPVSMGNVRLSGGGTLDVHKREDSVWTSQVDVFEPEGGYALWVERDQGDTLIVEPIALQDESPSEAAPASPVQTVQIQMLASKNGALDVNNYMRLIAGAKNRLDSHDRREPPVVGDYVSAFLVDNLGNALSTDARPDGDGPVRWTIQVQTATPGRVDLTFEGIESLDSQKSVHLIDRTTGVSLDLRDRPIYSLAAGGTHRRRQLELWLGDGEEQPRTSEPTTGELEIFPNPFSSAATVRLRTAKPGFVSLGVYDVLGRKVETLIEDAYRDAGTYAEVFEIGRGRPSGLYFVLMELDGTQVSVRSVSVVR